MAEKSREWWQPAIGKPTTQPNGGMSKGLYNTQAQPKEGKSPRKQVDVSIVKTEPGNEKRSNPAHSPGAVPVDCSRVKSEPLKEVKNEPMRYIERAVAKGEFPYEFNWNCNGVKLEPLNGAPNINTAFIKNETKHCFPNKMDGFKKFHNPYMHMKRHNGPRPNFQFLYSRQTYQPTASARAWWNVDVERALMKRREAYLLTRNRDPVPVEVKMERLWMFEVAKDEARRVIAESKWRAEIMPEGMKEQLNGVNVGASCSMQNKHHIPTVRSSSLAERLGEIPTIDENNTHEKAKNTSVWDRIGSIVTDETEVIPKDKENTELLTIDDEIEEALNYSDDDDIKVISEGDDDVIFIQRKEGEVTIIAQVQGRFVRMNRKRKLCVTVNNSKKRQCVGTSNNGESSETVIDDENEDLINDCENLNEINCTESQVVYEWSETGAENEEIDLENVGASENGAENEEIDFENGASENGAENEEINFENEGESENVDIENGELAGKENECMESRVDRDEIDDIDKGIDDVNASKFSCQVTFNVASGEKSVDVQMERDYGNDDSNYLSLRLEEDNAVTDVPEDDDNVTVLFDADDVASLDSTIEEVIIEEVMMDVDSNEVMVVGSNKQKHIQSTSESDEITILEANREDNCSVQEIKTAESAMDDTSASSSVRKEPSDKEVLDIKEPSTETESVTEKDSVEKTDCESDEDLLVISADDDSDFSSRSPQVWRGHMMPKRRAERPVPEEIIEIDSEEVEVWDVDSPTVPKDESYLVLDASTAASNESQDDICIEHEQINFCRTTRSGVATSSQLKELQSYKEFLRRDTNTNLPPPKNEDDKPSLQDGFKTSPQTPVVQLNKTPKLQDDKNEEALRGSIKSSPCTPKSEDTLPTRLVKRSPQSSTSSPSSNKTNNLQHDKNEEALRGNIKSSPCTPKSEDTLPTRLVKRSPQSSTSSPSSTTSSYSMQTRSKKR